MCRDGTRATRPYKNPHPPLRIAAVTDDSSFAVGRRGRPIFLAVRTSSISELKRFVVSYHAGWREARHPRPGEVDVIVPVYVSDTERRARDETPVSTMHLYKSIGEALLDGPLRAVGERIRRMSFDD